MWATLALVASRQHGVVSVSQAEALGIAPRTLHDRAAREGWTRLARGVYLMPGHRVTEWVRLWAGLLAVTEAHRPGQEAPVAGATGATAAWIRGYLDRAPGKLTIVVPHGLSVPRIPGLHLLRSRTLMADDIGTFREFPTATLARLSMDLAAQWDRPRLRGLLIDARQQGADLVPVIERVAQSTYFPGRGRLRRALADVDGDAVDSVFAKLVGDWLRANGFFPVAEYPIVTPTGTVHADHALVEFQIILECDGFGAHSTRASLTTDARRSNGLALCPDWLVLRITWDRFEREADAFLDEIHAAVATQRARLGLDLATLGAVPAAIRRKSTQP